MNHLLKKAVASATFASILMSGAVFADSSNTTNDIPTPPVITVAAPQTEIAPVVDTTKSISKVIAKGTTLITQRTTALGKLKTKITGAKQLTDDQKTALTTMIDKNVTDLMTLSTTLAGETDIAKAKADVKSIYSTFRIYAVFIPKVSHLIGLYIQQAHANTLLNTTFPKLQTKLDAWKARGIDTTTFQSSLDTAKTTLITIQGQITNLMTKVTAVQPSDYPATSKTTFSDVKTGMKSITTQLTTLRKTLSWKAPKVSKKTVK